MTNATDRQEHACAVCGGAMASRLDAAIHHCRACGFWASDFAPIPEGGCATGRSRLVESERFAGLRTLREHNFRRILALLERHGLGPGSTLCDIGCAYGWFLEIARQRGLHAIGVEPEAAVAAVGIRQGLDVRVGFFPDVLADGEQFDFLVFNDVLEHLPNVRSMLDHCKTHLRPGGKLVINIPSSAGLWYRVSCLLARLGVRGPFDRLWQKHFPCPHVSYFNPRNLRTLVAGRGLQLVHEEELPSVLLQGLWNRLNMDAAASPASRAAMYAGTLALYPLQRLMPSDIVLHIYQKPGK